MSEIFFYTSRGKKLPYKQGDFKASDVVTTPVVQRIRVRQSNTQGLEGSSVRVTNPAASQFGRARLTPSLGMGGVGQQDV